MNAVPSAFRNMIGIAQYKVSKAPTDILIAPNLGSCLGIAVYDPKNRWGGMIHCLLPLSKNNPDKASAEPATYVDTGLVLLLTELTKLGSDKKDFVICVAGGSNINDENRVFEIGVKNYTILKKVLWKNGLLIKAEHVGDSISRTISLDIGTGEVTVKASGETIKLV